MEAAGIEKCRRLAINRLPNATFLASVCIGSENSSRRLRRYEHSQHWRESTHLEMIRTGRSSAPWRARHLKFLSPRKDGAYLLKWALSTRSPSFANSTSKQMQGPGGQPLQW